MFTRRTVKAWGSDKKRRMGVSPCQRGSVVDRRGRLRHSRQNSLGRGVRKVSHWY